MTAKKSAAAALLQAGALATAVLAAAGCASDDQSGAGASQDATALAGSRWQATEIGGVATVAQAITTLAFYPPGRVSGGAGCNRFSAPADLGSGSIRIGPLISTKMACPEPNMQQESRFFTTLANAQRWWVGGDGGLVLADAASAPLIVFRREQ